MPQKSLLRKSKRVPLVRNQSIQPRHHAENVQFQTLNNAPAPNITASVSNRRTGSSRGTIRKLKCDRLIVGIEYNPKPAIDNPVLNTDSLTEICKAVAAQGSPAHRMPVTLTSGLEPFTGIDHNIPGGRQTILHTTRNTSAF